MMPKPCSERCRQGSERGRPGCQPGSSTLADRFHRAYCIYYICTVAVEGLLFVVLSRENPDPMYKQVFVQIRDAVGTGELQVDEKLPSIREMAKALGVSVITIKRAYLELENQGYIYSRPGLGSFVADVSLKRLRAGKLREIQRELEALTGSAAKFGISTDEIIQLMHGLKEKRNVGRSKNRRPHKTLSGVHSE